MNFIYYCWEYFSLLLFFFSLLLPILLFNNSTKFWQLISLRNSLRRIFVVFFSLFCITLLGIQHNNIIIKKKKFFTLHYLTPHFHYLVFNFLLVFTLYYPFNSPFLIFKINKLLIFVVGLVIFSKFQIKLVCCWIFFFFLFINARIKIAVELDCCWAILGCSNFYFRAVKIIFLKKY